MNKKILVAILTVAIIVVCLYVYFEISSNQKTSLDVTDILIKDSLDHFTLRITVSLPSGVQTLYNCHIKVEYLTKSGAWKTASKNIGIINYADYTEETFYLDGDFKTSIPNLKPDNYYHNANYESNIKLEAYGYLTP